ncbi:autotransporter outer membrane beta-barrel domain-containing protein [Hoeflea poritis]|uniref:Autotransporter outer membrane beta-barrel domain-containing protein n=1 Tax=Hoeflea poritis TaxID=2993659 RepID=A0ABT4VGT2_9HYPH|nr:autotransporter outer membrane beta-barrel domain-containing protein [Hoeflea poritis]MDA4843819.1 autotransporter outer membrane beta-barrel domain-containing protein [Hoeflea poritis]
MTLLFAALGGTPSQAQCVATGSTLNCSGDLSNGVSSSTNDLDTLNIFDLTTDIGQRGVDFRNNAGLDINFNAVLNDPFAFALMPPSNGSFRNGFHIRTDGSITGTLTGDVTGPTLRGGSIGALSSALIQNFGAIGLDAGGAIDFQHDGQVNVSREDISRSSAAGSNRVDLTAGRFAAIRLESESGNVDVVNNGNITIDGGSRTVANDDTSMDPTGTATITFTNGVSENIGLFAQGNDDLNIRQTGDITITRGDASAFSRTQANIADAQADASDSFGIYIPRFILRGGTVDPTLPVFENIDIAMTGNISITGGESRAEAIGFNLAADGTGQEAVAQAIRVSSFAAGVNIANGEAVTYVQTGNVSVTGENSTAEAFAVGSAIDDANGPVHADARGQSAQGYSVRPAFTFNGPRPDTTRVDLTVNGDTTVVGGDASARATGTDIATLNQLALDLPNNQASEALESSAGGAIGISASANALSLDVNGTIDVTGGNASGELSGAGINSEIVGGNATGLSYSSSQTQFIYVHDQIITATGGNATATLNGDGLSTTVRGGSATGLQSSLNGITGSSHTQRAAITVTGGDASSTGPADATVDVNGGGAIGISGSTSGPIAQGNERAMFRNEAVVTARGGNATRNNGTSSGISRGGAATGFRTTIFGPLAPLVQHAGTIEAIAGTGPERRGTASGVLATDFGAASIGTDGSQVGNNVILEVTGDISVTGEGDSFSFGASDFSGGVIAKMSGNADISVDGAAINAAGAGTTGITVAAQTSTVNVVNGATIRSTGTDAAGIMLAPSENVFVPEQKIASTNRVNIADGASVVAEDGTGIRDVGTTMISVRNPDTLEFEEVEVERDNATTIDIAGMVTGGNGTAIDLGSGADTAIFRQTAVINGNTLLGVGEDRFLYQGFTETKAVDGGADRDRVVVNAASGTDDMFDPTVNIPNFTNFEAITKTGAGTLTINGVPFTGPLDFEVDEGLGIIGSDQPNIGVIVASGATFRTDQNVGDITNLAGGLVEGTGTSGNFTNSGTFSPGNSIGTFTVMEDLMLQPDGTLAVEIEAPDQADLVDVGGTTTLDGTLSVTGIGMLNAFSEGQTYTVIDGDGPVSGAFAEVIDNLPDFDVVPEIVNDGGGQNVVLALAVEGSGSDTDLSDKSIVPNGQQAQVKTGRVFAGTLEDRMAGAETARIAVLDNGTINAYAPQPKAPAPAALGGIYNADAGFGDIVARPVRTAWFSGIGGFGEADATAFAPGYQNDIYGVAAGVDIEHKTEGFDWIIGGAAGYTASDVTSGSGSSDVDTFHLGVYGRIDRGPARLSAQISYGFQSYDFARVIPVGATTATAAGSADGQLFTAAVKGAYDIAPRFGWGQDYGLRVAPAAALGYVYTRRNAFTETGAGILNQAYGADVFERGYLRTGVELGAAVTLDNGSTFRPHGGLYWEWGFGDDNIVANSTAPAVPGSAFASPGAIESDGGPIIEAGFDLDFTRDVSAQANYEGAFSDTGNSHRFSGGIKIRF